MNNIEQRCLRAIDKAIALNGDKFDYSLVSNDFLNLKSKVRIYCNTHSVWFEQRMQSHLEGKKRLLAL